jgi:hypothetical protein
MLIGGALALPTELMSAYQKFQETMELPVPFLDRRTCDVQLL